MESPKNPKDEPERDTAPIVISDRKEKILEQKYQDAMKTNLELRSILSEQCWEDLEWKNKCKHLDNVFYQESAKHESKRQEWMKYKDDVLKIVRDADDYVVDAMKEINAIEEEKRVLKEKVADLERKIANLMGDGDYEEPQLIASSDSED